MLKRIQRWFVGRFYRKEILLENILVELRNLHYHMDKMESFYMLVNNIKTEEEENTENRK